MITSKPVPVAVLLSGGLDSAAVLALAVELHGADKVAAVFCDYDQKALKQERSASQRLAAWAGVRWYEYVVEFDGGSIVVGGEGALSGPDTVVPERNSRMIAFAFLHGEEVWYGPTSGDWEQYEDCRPDFVASFFGSVVAPFLYLTKADVVEVCLRLQVPMIETWSCYEPAETREGPKACEKCGSCRARHAAYCARPLRGRLS